jgi:hypothetical protein
MINPGSYTQIPPLLDPHTKELVIEDFNKSELFNNFFSSISPINDEIT